MTKSDLMARLAVKCFEISAKEVELATREILEQMTCSLQRGHRIEIRGFGSFSLHYRSPHIAKNPRTGRKLKLSGKYIPHFKPGKKLRDRVNRVP